jgi:hypothetical protein
MKKHVPDAVNGDPPPLWDNAALSKAFRDLEPKLDDLRNMTRLASWALEDVIGESHKETTREYNQYFITDWQRDVLSFAAYHVENMVRSMHADYHAKLEGEAAAEVQSVRASTGASRPPASIKAGDPIYVAIDAHRTAMKALEDALTVRSGLCKNQESAEYKKADARADVLGTVEDQTLRALARTTPTSLGGATEALRYITGYYDGTSDVFDPGVEHELFSDRDLLFGFVSRVCDVITAALKEVA